MKKQELNLLDLMEIEEAKESPQECKHKYEEKSFHTWDRIPGERMIWRCLSCGRIRGRVDNKS